MFDFLSSIVQIQDLRNKRVSSYDQTGGNADYVVAPSGETVTLADIPESGMVKHIWLTLRCDDPMIRRNAVLRMYWDGEEHSSVECPLGDFFGQGWGEAYPFLSLPMAAAPEHGRALNSYWPMPFGDGARITLENQSDLPIVSLYYYVDYEIHPQIDERQGRFHAWWNRQITVPQGGAENEWSVLGPTPKNRSDEHNHLFAEIEGRGHFAGIHYYVDTTQAPCGTARATTCGRSTANLGPGPCTAREQRTSSIHRGARTKSTNTRFSATPACRVNWAGWDGRTPIASSCPIPFIFRARCARASNTDTQMCSRSTSRR